MKNRGLVAALVLAAVLVAGVASAGSFGERETGSWLEQLAERVAVWLGLAPEEPGFGVAIEADGGGGSTPQSGSCFDPFGRPKPCV